MESCGYANWKGIDRCTDNRRPAFFKIASSVSAPIWGTFFTASALPPNSIWNKQVASQKAAVPWNKETWKSKIERPQTRQMISEASIPDFFCQLVRISKFPQSCPWDKWPHLAWPYHLIRWCQSSSRVPGRHFVTVTCRSFAKFSNMVSICNFFENHSVSGFSVCCRVADVTSWEGIQKLYCRTIYHIYICPTSNF